MPIGQPANKKKLSLTGWYIYFLDDVCHLQPSGTSADRFRPVNLDNPCWVYISHVGLGWRVVKLFYTHHTYIIPFKPNLLHPLLPFTITIDFSTPNVGLFLECFLFHIYLRTHVLILISESYCVHIVTKHLKGIHIPSLSYYALYYNRSNPQIMF